jgi:hypothetical protein
MGSGFTIKEVKVVSSKFCVLLPVDDDDARGGTGGGEIVAKANGLNLGGVEFELDQTLAHGLSATFGEGAGVIVREVGLRVTGDEQTRLLVAAQFGDDATDGTFMRGRELEAIAFEDEGGAGGFKIRSQR